MTEPKSPRRARSRRNHRPQRVQRTPGDLMRTLKQPSRSQLVVGLLVGLLGFAAVTQVRSTQRGDAYAGLRSADLIQVLNGLNAESRRADKEITDLRNTRNQLLDSSQRAEAATTRAKEQSTTLGILAGTLPVHGSGVRVTVVDKQHAITLNNILDGIEELRSAGAEAIEINDTVRVVAQTSFDQDDKGLLVDGKRLTAPYVIDAIGDPGALDDALNFVGGFAYEVKTHEGTVKIKQVSDLKITSVRSTSAPTFASPAANQ